MHKASLRKGDFACPLSFSDNGWRNHKQGKCFKALIKIKMMQERVVRFPSVQKWMLSLMKHQLLQGNGDMSLPSLQWAADLQTSGSKIQFIPP